MSNTAMLRRLVLSFTVFLVLLAALPATAATLIPDKTKIAVGETIYIRLDANRVIGIDWSADQELQIVASDRKGATVKGVSAGTATVTAKWLGGKKSTKITVGDVAAAKDQAEDDKEAVRMEGLARAMGMPDLDARIARMLFEVNSGTRSPKQFYEGLAAAGGKMIDVIRVRSTLVDHADQSFTRQIMGPTYSENGTPVEEKILTWRRAETLAAIDEVVKKFIDAGRLPANGFELIISHVGKWANQSDRSLTFTGDIDFSFVSNDVGLAQAMKDAYTEVIKRRTKLDQIALDSVATAHGKAGLEVYIGRHGMAFAEEQMKINEVVDMTTGARTKIEGDGAAMRMAAILTIERTLADAAGVETKQPVANTEPGLSLEMARHFQHDIVEPKIFDVTNAVVKAAKYLDRSYKALDNAGGQPADPALADFAKQVTALANAKPQTKATREAILQRISDHMGSPARTIWDMGTNKLVLTIDAAAVERFHQDTTKAIWDTVRQGSTTRTNELDQRLRDLLERQRKGDNVDEDVAKLRQDMVDMVDMVESEIKAAHGTDIPIEVHSNNAKVRAMLDTLSKRFGVKALSAEELKDKKFVEELLKAQAQHPDPSRLKMLTGYIMDRTARAAELSMTGVEKTNQLLDIIDDRLMGPLRGDSDFAEFEAEMKQVRQTSMDPRLRSESMGRLSTVKTRVAGAIKNTNLYLNEKLQATAAGRQGMKFMMVYGLVDEMQAYRDAFNDQGWGGFATEIFKRRIPFGGAVENVVMGNTYRAGWDVVTTLIPPLGLPEAAYGLGTMIGTQTRAAFWSEQLSLFTDGLYADAIFKLEDVQSYEGAKVGVYRLVRTFHNDMPLDLHRFAEMRKDQVEALSKEVEAGHVNWQAYKNNFNGLTEWLDVDATLKANLAASDPALALLEEMANHPAVGPKLMDRLAEKGLARWEQVKLGFITKLIQHLEDRKQADDALARGMLPDLFAELRKVSADLSIEDEVMKGLDAEVDTSNLKGLMKWLWDAKRYTLSQAPTESETSRAAQAVKKYLDAYKQIQAMRDQAAGQLARATSDVGTRYLTTSLFLSGRADPDIAAAHAWLTHIETSRKNAAAALLAIKRSFVPKIGLDSSDQDYLDRAFGQELWIKPNQDAGTIQKKKWMLDRAAGHAKERDKILAEYKDWLKKVGPVQLTVTAVDAKDSRKKVGGLKIALSPTDELGSPVSASGAGNQVVAAVAMGRYRLTASAPGYLDASKNVVLGRGLNAAPSEALSLTPSGKEPDKDKDDNKNGKDDTTTDPLPVDVTDGKDEVKKPLPIHGAGGSASGQFPGEPFNGMQISYSFSGCSLPEMKDSPGFTTSRGYKGRLGSGSMTVSGSARMGNGYGATLTVSVNAGGEHKEYTSYIKSGWPGFNTDTFSLTIPIPATATSGGFGIRMAGEYNAGGRGLVVSGTCSADGPDGAAPKGTENLSVTLSGPKEPVPLGKDAEVSAQTKGGRFPYSYTWEGAAGSGEKAKARIKRPGSQTVAVTVADSDGQRAGANVTIQVAPLKLKLLDVPKKTYYGSQSKLNVGGLPDFTPPPAAAADLCPPPYDSPFCVDYKHSGSVNRTGNAPPADTNQPHYIPDPDREDDTPPMGQYRFVWQSEPGLSFDPATSSDGRTTVTFDRMGEVKIWTEVLQNIDGAWQTVGETDQETVNVVAPLFSLKFDPPAGQGKIGQDVRATVVARPEVPAKLIDYRWFDPTSRMEYGDNASEIGFKIKDAKPVALKALARVPYHGDEIAEIADSYTGVSYEVKINAPHGKGPQLQVWVCDTQLGNARQCGMKDIPQGQFVTFQDIYLQAEVLPAPPSPRYQWTVSPSGSCGWPGSGSELHLNCSNTGSYVVRLKVFDADKLLLGEAETSVSVSANGNDVKQAPKSKAAHEKMQQARQQADRGQLDEAIANANEATALDPNNAETKDQAKRWNAERDTVRQQIERANKALQAGKPDDAQREIDAARKLHPKYPPVLEAERQVASKGKMASAASGTAAADFGFVANAGIPGNNRETHNNVSVEECLRICTDRTWCKSVDYERQARRCYVQSVAQEDASLKTDYAGNPYDHYYHRQRLSQPIPDTGQAGGLAGAWSINANNYTGKIEFASADGSLSGRVWFDAHKRWEDLESISFDGRTVRFRRPGPNQWYTGTLSGDTVQGGFTSYGSDYKWSMTRAAGSVAGTGNVAGNVSGNWKTSEGTLTLDQNGRRVSGSYSSDGGEIVGEMNGNVLDGWWIENGSSKRCATARNGRYYWGRIRWTFTGTTFAGIWSYCEEPVSTGTATWKGERIGAAPATTTPSTPATSGGASLSLDRTGFVPGESISLSFTAPANWPDNAWVGIIPSTIPHGDERQNDNHDISYQYLKKRTSGTLTFTAPAAGDWDFRLHDTDNNGKEQASVSFRVGTASTAGGRAYTSPTTTLVTPATATLAVGSGGPETTFQGHRYRAILVPGGINWADADRAARNLGGYLATIASAAENDAVYGLVKNDDRYWFQDSYRNGLGPWLGGMQPTGSAEPRGGWRWATDEPFGFSNWASGEPNNSGGVEDRLHLFGPGTLKGPYWNDAGGNGALRGYIVEFGAATAAVPGAKSDVSFDNGNTGGVGNGPSQPTTFTFNEARVVTLIQDYHWNSARGATPGSIAVRDASGRVYGPWQAAGSPGQGGVPNAYWTAKPNATLPAGTYTVIDSDPASWSHNGQSGYRGFTRVEGYPAGSGQAAPTPTTGKPDGVSKQVDDLLDAVKSLKGLFGN